MALELSSGISKNLPSSVKNSLAKLSIEEQAVFEEEFKRKMKSPFVLLFIAIFFPIHYFLLGKVGLGLLFLFTLGGLYVWWFIDIFRAVGMAKDYNEEVARSLLRDMKIMAS